jgi:hypothetical protein
VRRQGVRDMGARLNWDTPACAGRRAPTTHECYWPPLMAGMITGVRRLVVACV